MGTVDLYTSQNYKDVIRQRLKERQTLHPSLTLRKIADLIPVQYTYLSKVLNNDEVHLNEDHLFTICQVLSMSHEEMEFLMLLRSWAVTGDRERKKYLQGQLDNKRREKKLDVEQKANDSQKLATEMSFWLNPLCIVVHVAMSNQILRKNPQHLCSQLGISLRQLKGILKILALNDLIDLGSDQLTVKATKQIKFHLGHNHPLMRVHQNILKSHVSSRLSQTEEEQKKSFMVTFTSNERAFEKIKQEFQDFLKKVEDIARRGQRPQDNDQVYHLNFDFFRWV